MKLARIGAICMIAASLFLSACQPQAAMAPPETFEISSQQVTFTPPAESWGEKKIASLPHDGNDQKTPDTVVSFIPPIPNSSLTVSGMGNWPQSSWEENQEATNDFTRQIQTNILKRSQGEIIKQRTAHLDGEPALELEVRYLEATTLMHGKQLYAIHNKTMWVIALNVPEDKWKEHASIYDQLIDSWKFK